MTHEIYKQHAFNVSRNNSEENYSVDTTYKNFKFKFKHRNMLWLIIARNIEESHLAGILVICSPLILEKRPRRCSILSLSRVSIHEFIISPEFRPIELNYTKN